MKKLFLAFSLFVLLLGCDLFNLERSVVIDSNVSDYHLFLDGETVEGSTIPIRRGIHELTAYAEGYDVIVQEVDVQEDMTVFLDFTALTSLISSDFSNDSQLGTADQNFSVLQDVENPIVFNSKLTVSPVDGITATDNMWILSYVNNTPLTKARMAIHLQVEYDLRQCGNFFFHVLDGSRISDNAHSFCHIGFNSNENFITLDTVIEETTGAVNDTNMNHSYDPSILTTGINTMDILINETYFMFILNDNLVALEELDLDYLVNPTDFNIFNFGFGVHSPAISDDIIIHSIKAFQ